MQPADESLDDVVFMAGDISSGEVYSTTPRFGSARSQIRIPSDLLMERAQADGKSHIIIQLGISMKNVTLPEIYTWYIYYVMMLKLYSSTRLTCLYEASKQKKLCLQVIPSY